MFLRNIAVTLIVIAALAGCAAINKAGRQAAGMGVLTDQNDGFTGTRWIQLSPAPVGGTTGMLSSCCKVGVAWTPAVPDGVVLTVEVPAIVALSSVSLNINGNIKKLEPIDQFTQFGGDISSHKGYFVPWVTIKDLPNDSEAKILVTTLSSGSVAGNFLTSDGGMFIDVLPGFISAVHTARSQ